MKKGRMILLFCGVVWTSMMSVGFAQHPFSLRIHIPGQLDKVIVEIQKSGHGIERGDLSFRGEWAQMVGDRERRFFVLKATDNGYIDKVCEKKACMNQDLMSSFN